MEKLLGIRLLCLKTGCQEIISEFDILKEDTHSLRISMADQTGEADERTIKKKWIGEITEYALGDNGVEFKTMCLPGDKTESISLLRDAMTDFIAKLRDNLNALEKSVSEYQKEN